MASTNALCLALRAASATTEREGNSTPCYTVSSYSVEIGNRNPVTMAKALEEMGFSIRLIANQINFSGVHKETGQYHSGSYINGKLTFTGELEVNAVKRAYAEVTLKTQAAKKGWTLKKTAAGEYQVTKR